MSSKRGRKRNDNLPPNRARDVQRAFRARRAAHLEALESRVAQLTEENNTLRIALGLPPSDLPPLGKGPTGKDRPKGDPSMPTPTASGISATLSSLASDGRPLPPLSRTESPLSAGSTSGHSMSPDPIGPGLSLSQTSPPGLDPSGWNDSMFGEKDSDHSLSSSSYSLPPASSLPAPFPHIPRSANNDIFSSNQNYAHGDDKSFGYLPSEDRRSYPYSHPLLSAHQSAQSQLPPSLPSGGSDADLAPFLQRRAMTEPDSYRPLLSQMSSVSSQQNGLQSSAHGSRVSSAMLGVDAPHLSGFDLPGGAERRFPRLH